MDSNLRIIAETSHSTIVAEYKPSNRNSEKYQSESDLETELIKVLEENGYEYLPIKNSDELLNNLRRQISRLNDYEFSNSEWERFKDEYICKKGDGIEAKTEKIQENEIFELELDPDKSQKSKNIKILDKQNIGNNFLQVINQYETDGGHRSNRYDVTILVNGLPMCHIELKKRGTAIREAFNQINRYQRDSFWADSGLFGFIQIFIISNGTNTKYYSNTTRSLSLKERSGKYIDKQISASFEFTSWWTDSKNKRISDLIDFAKTFLSKHTLLSVIIKYCVFTVDKNLLAMRPYQIAGCEKILEKILMTANEHQKIGTREAGGYIWHTTGSGKTLTSFKTAQLASKIKGIDKVMFIVDRKDLDYQTMREYDKFEEGAANSNASTKELIKQLIDPNKKIIITTIQKLDRFINSSKNVEVFDKHFVLIFDECHRSQFGAMHAKIIKFFKKYNMFGFTGTPIFAKNAGGMTQLKSTGEVFGELLHSYNLSHAIDDGTVLKFLVEFNNVDKENIQDKRILLSPKRIEVIVAHILEHFNQKTKRNEHYLLKDRRLSGFNSILATSEIAAARLYYAELKKQQKSLPEPERLKIALIYSFSANTDGNEDGILPDEDFDADSMDKSDRDFLDNAIKDYNKIFKVSFDAGNGFQNYYKDVSQRVKEREIDILIVVNMFLTGFDATTLNTLWVDKNLRQHGLLQAFSRTNRILNRVKDFGHIICYRNLDKAADEAIADFGDENARDIVFLRPYEDYYNGYDEDGKHNIGYVESIEKLQNIFPLQAEIIGEAAQKDFIQLFGKILRAKNTLSSFDKFEGQEILGEREFQDYQSIYLDLYDKYRPMRQPRDADREIINDDIVFEIELIKQVEINVDYILEMVKKYHKSESSDKKEMLITIEKTANSDLALRNKKDLILRFMQTVNADVNISQVWRTFVKKRYEEDIEEIIKEQNLDRQKTREFMRKSFDNGLIDTIGTDFTDILPSNTRIFPDVNRKGEVIIGEPKTPFVEEISLPERESIVFRKLQAFFNEYFGII